MNRVPSQFFITMDLQAYYEASVAAKNAELTEAEVTEKAAAKVDALNARYSVFGRVAAESLEILPLIDTATVINSIDIEVK